MNPCLAQLKNLDDWVQIIVIVLVVVGGAIGPVLKKLLEFFSPSRGAKPGEFVEIELEPEHPRPEPPPPVVATPPPLRQVQASAPPRVPRSAPALERVDHRAVPPDSVSRHPPIAAPLSGARPNTKRSGSRGTEVAENPKSRRSGSSRRQETATAGRVSREGKETAKAKRSSLRRDSRFELSELHQDMDAAVQQTAAGSDSYESSAGGKFTPLGATLFSASDPASLQRAVILSEILAPPVSMRPLEQQI